MFAPKSKYTLNLPFGKEELIEKLRHSPGFQVEKDYGYYGTMSTESRINQVFVRGEDTDVFQMSENAGLGSLFELIATVNIESFGRNNTLLKLKFQMGIFPVILPQLSVLSILILGIVLMTLTKAFFYLSLIISPFFLVWWFTVYFRVRIFLKIVSKAIGAENSWT